MAAEAVELVEVPPPGGLGREGRAGLGIPALASDRFALLRELAAKGKSVIVVSSQLDELLVACDRIAVLRRGELGRPRPASEWTEETLLLEAAS